MAEDFDTNQSNAHFESVQMHGARFRRVDLSGARFQAVDMSGVVMRGVDLIDVDISGEVENLVINGVDVTPLIEAELDRRQPDRVKMRPTDPEGFRDAWHLLDRIWEGTIDRARGFTSDQLNESVNGEWSFIETLRHLTFATDSWIGRAILGDPTPWHPLGLPFDEWPDGQEFTRARDAHPSLDTILEIRRGRTSTLRDYLATLTDETLASHTTPVDFPGWPPPKSYAVRNCLLVVLNEEWQHRLYAERDFDILDDR
jgi:hypothetical protein